MKIETMLGYDWGNAASIMLSAEESTAHVSEPNRPIFDPYTTQNYQTANFNPDMNFTTTTTAAHHQHFPVHHSITNTHFGNFHDPPAYATYPHPHAPAPSMLTQEPAAQSGFMVVLKREPMGDGQFNSEYNSRIGLNLGGRTYFASSENDFMNRVYLRSKILEPGSMSFPKCRAEGCIADLSNAKHYHRRHKVCEFHSKAATVVAAGLTQRFCQQCSRFHLLSEFDNGKRSCRRRLADHNRRRRKSHQQPNNQENMNKFQLHHNINGKDSSSENLTRSSPDDSENYSSSAIAISPPRISLDCSGQRSYTGGGATTSSINSIFY